MKNKSLWILVLSITLISLFFLFMFPMPIQKRRIRPSTEGKKPVSHEATEESTNTQIQHSVQNEDVTKRNKEEDFTPHQEILKEQKKRQDRLRAKCSDLNRNNLWDKVNTAKFLFKGARKPRLYYSDKHKVIVCGVPKCGSTEWRKALLIVEGDVAAKTPQEIEHERSFTLAKQKRFLWNNFPASKNNSLEELDKRLNGYFRVLTVREPLERVVSAYLDKMIPGGTAVEMYKRMSRNIHRKFAKDRENFKEDWATFEEFVDSILAAPGSVDVHWQHYSTICDPCHVHYDYISKLETIVEDSAYISERIGMNQSLLFDGEKKPRTDSQEKYGKYEERLRQLPPEKLKRLFQVYRTQYELFDYPVPLYIQS